MKRIPMMLCLAAAATLAAQTASKPAPHPAKTTAATHPASATGYKLPPGEKRAPGIPKPVFSTWRYQDIVVGTGPEGESGKLWHVKYKGWRAADGVVFDSWENNRRPEFKDGKPVMGPDNKPVLGPPQPLMFPQGMGRLIPGFDWGLSGMRVGGKRRIFIPWELAYGTRAIPDRPDHPGIPAKSDLIFDVELVDV
ncbi:MAG TPA: FKBP-type peptidyl-prolyl cis-trans isomerase, partial [Terracidiphilus sp.]|nr:FKBP-type peptidyl-prolyl cis-trans isomerase [Terracidiphilus sp.]